MNELAIIPNSPEITRLPDRTEVAIQRLSDWAHSAQAAHEIAGTLVQTSFVPEQFRNKPGEATAAILAGLEVGLNPMASLRSFDIIQGTAAPRAITLRAIVQSQGHEMVLVESSDAKCRMRGKRRGSSEWQEVLWTIDRARKLKLTNKPNWQNQPQAMLLARATSELSRLIASDAILGIGYAVEEIEDQEPEPTRTVARQSSGEKRTVARRPAPAEADEPSLDDDVSDAELVEDEPEPAAPADDGEAWTSAQQKKIMARYGELGVTDRDRRLAITRGLLDLPEMETTAELTKMQASHLIEVICDDGVTDESDLLAAAGLLEPGAS